MKRFLDQNENKVTLAFRKKAFPLSPGHVLVIGRWGENWLLTKHPIRGLEFPGGKAEHGEPLEAAAERELYEETGGVAEKLIHIGEYLVEDKENGSFVKAVFYARIARIEEKKDYLETAGPVLMADAELQNLGSSAFSFIMQDGVVPSAIDWIREHVLEG